MIKKSILQLNGGLKFFIFVIVIYILLAIFNFQLFCDSLTIFLDFLKKILPILLLVFVLMFLFNLILDRKKILKYLGKKSGHLGYLFSIIFGIISVGPIYTWYPLLADLKKKGARDSLLVIFLYNRAVKIPLLPMMIFYFGFDFIVIFTIYMIGFSVINGVLIEKIMSYKKEFL